ncbi:hypothetical protein NO263_09090 [Gluconacetobacter entanii]|uniref:Uncharacterized protein n=1 Tax=Gluconacetobacter entanii TaxID=108528 RepID=A0ABT3K5Q5_9PROT|nr:hypothetical protein [Gluconacetobacter entanii]MCW4590735.1 hypothetical protein [Gluconacetobacter entanii]MCW4594204.1 hypothetical protein [Gluconacetobacter entanii]NPC89035.1 hypothetical protein [Gluconacetobacter entanii]
MTIDLSTNFFYDREDWEHFISSMLSGVSFHPTSVLVRALYPRTPDGYEAIHYNNHWVALSYGFVLAFTKDEHIIFPAFGIEVPLRGGWPEYFTMHHITYMTAVKECFLTFRQDVNALHDRLERTLVRFDPELRLVTDDDCGVYVEKNGRVIAHGTITVEQEVPDLLRQLARNLKSGIVLPIDAQERRRERRKPQLRRVYINGGGKEMIDNYVLKTRRRS